MVESHDDSRVVNIISLGMKVWPISLSIDRVVHKSRQKIQLDLVISRVA